MSSRHPRIDEKLGQIGAGGGGSNDVDSGGGAGSGIPDAETAARSGEAINHGDVAVDRQSIVGDVAGPPRHKHDPR
jgi:hypothetical protein